MTFSASRTAQQVSSHLRVAADLMAGRSQFASESFEAQYEAKELETYSLSKAIRGVLDPVAAADAPMEFDIGARAFKTGASQGRGLYIPFAVLARDLVAGTPAAGGNLVATHNSRDVAAWLRPASACAAAGATFLPNIRDNLFVPHLASGASAQLVSENAPAPATQPSFGGASLKPRTVTAHVVVSRRLDLQNPQIEALVSADLAAAVGQLLDELAINGSGTGEEPQGILSNTAVPVHSLGTNGAALTWSNVVSMETDVAVSNGDLGTVGYLTNAKVRGKLKGTSKVPGQNGFIWEGGETPLNSHRTAVSNSVPSNLTKGTSTGVCSAMVFGNFAELLIGIWGGGIEVTLDRHSLSTTGAKRLIVTLDIDVAVRRPQSFIVCKDILVA